QSLLNTDILIIPLPDSESFMPKYGIINNEEIDLLNDLLKGGKLIVLMIYDNKNGTLPSVVDTYNKLLIEYSSEFLIDSSGKYLIKNDYGDNESSVKIIAVDSFSEKQITDEIGIILGE
ncbi:MAG: hypothetical protein PWQ77_752, partial [Kosmotogales bacterium]|nr:hypothetical protein [Kosmotogales bacterium]